MAPPAARPLHSRAGLAVTPFRTSTQLLLYQQTLLPGAHRAAAACCTQLCSWGLDNPVLSVVYGEHSEMLCRETQGSCEQAKLQTKGKKNTTIA